MPRRSIKREKLPGLIERYFQVLEGKKPVEQLEEVLSPHVQFHDHQEHRLVGIDAVRDQIVGWRQSVRDPAVHMVRMTDHGDCVKVNFNVVCKVTVDDLHEAEVILPVIAMYEVDGGQITGIFEAWARVPPPARAYQ